MTEVVRHCSRSRNSATITRRVRAVVADGRFYDRADLDSLLVGVERLAQQSRRP